MYENVIQQAIYSLRKMRKALTHKIGGYEGRHETRRIVDFKEPSGPGGS